MFAEEIKKHLTEELIPFWKSLKDEANGGFYGYMDYELKIEKEAVKGCILNSRILWFFSNAYSLLGDKELLSCAAHAYDFLKKKCYDREYGGVYWSLTYDGTPEDTTKHTYNQAFAVYALSSYYEASKDRQALEMAEELFNLMEVKCASVYGYGEAYTREFMPETNDKLSENGVLAEKTMNTLLHVMEAYTQLYYISQKKEVAQRLMELLEVFQKHIYNVKTGRQEVFFDKEWNSLVDVYSYGHDIESSWLLDRALEVLKEKSCYEKISPLTQEIRQNIYRRAYIDHSLITEAENGVIDTTRVWWVQAEAVVGFLNGYQKEPGKKEYLTAAKDIWNYIKEYMIDKRSGSEWYWAVDENRRPLNKPIVEPWKCPYHNGRMCIEVIRRMQDVT